MPSVYVDGVGSLVGESLAAGFDAAGYDVVRPTEGMSASELQSMVLSVDTTVMVAVPSADCGAADLMSLSCILAAFRHAVYPGTKRVVLVSTVATWGKLVAEPGVAVTEDHFRRRAPLAGSIELKALEDQLMLLSRWVQVQRVHKWFTSAAVLAWCFVAASRVALPTATVHRTPPPTSHHRPHPLSLFSHDLDLSQLQARDVRGGRWCAVRQG